MQLGVQHLRCYSPRMTYAEVKGDDASGLRESYLVVSFWKVDGMSLKHGLIHIPFSQLGMLTGCETKFNLSHQSKNYLGALMSDYAFAILRPASSSLDQPHRPLII